MIFLILLIVMQTGSVHAEGRGSVEALRDDNIFYAYVNSGENLDVAFVRVNSPSTDPVQQTPAVFTVSRPGAADVSCTISGSALSGSDCTWSNLTATSSGIWRIKFEVAKQVPTNHSWAITVQNGSTDILGRVWSNSYWISQAIGGQTTNSPDIELWYQSQQGYQYKSVYNDYYGIDSIFQATAFGIVEPGTCKTIYKSISTGAIPDTDIVVNDPTNACSGQYKVFFAAPASDLPATASKWDSGTEWIKPTVTDPTISDLKLTTNGSETTAGTVSFDTTNYIGSADLLVDANGDGDYDDSVDRSLPVNINTTNGQTDVVFDGKDGQGVVIPRTQKMTFQIKLAKVGEIHFVNTDGEKREGGIEVTRLNGAAAGRKTIFWDDRNFVPYNSQRCSTTPNQNGLAGVDSTGGTHGWNNTGCANQGNDNDDEPTNTGSYGDARHIHDWTYAPTPVITAEYTYLPDVYVECETEIGSPCTIEIPEFCQSDLLTDPREGTSVIENGSVTYTPSGNVSEEENYVHLRQDDNESLAKCFIKIKFIPKGTNTGAAQTVSPATIAFGSSGILLAGIATKKYGIKKLFSIMIRK